jgi:hypothetical protein
MLVKFRANLDAINRIITLVKGKADPLFRTYAILLHLKTQIRGLAKQMLSLFFAQSPQEALV